ncbi:fasciclin domain-containing protein [Longibacter salinarum]|uniref:fasciclin domain-containing protein n=1 Tax=Longibacter salinarum TaxID=1850348 RepID=UPI001FE53C0A|nr:fasciclin domain-containing protein [Longibacter salinarum]
MPRLRSFSFLLVLTLALIATGCDSGGSAMDDDMDSENEDAVTTLADVVNDIANLSTLGAALEATGQDETLADENTTFTVFAPANAAFDNVDVESLTNNPDLTTRLLNYHVVAGEALTASDLEGRQSVTTVEGQELPIASENGTLTVGGIPVTQADVEADNGVAHVIDGVLVPDSFPQRISYDLAAQSNGGALPNGVDGTVTFWEAGDTQTLVTLSLTDGPTGTTVSHPAHIHNNTASEGGSIAIYLSPIDGTNANSANDGTSARLVDRPFDELATFNGYVNIHESVANLDNVVSQGNIGANATGTFGAGLALLDNPQTTTYPLQANANSGSVAPSGIPGEITFRELTTDLTLATVRLDVDGDGQYEDDATGADVSHPGHIHANSASEGGDIQYYLSPIDGTDPAARSSQIIDLSFGDLTSFDGYVNIHESAANLQEIVSQGNIGANEGTGTSSPDVTVTLTNVGASAWEVANVEGATGVAASGENPTLTLTVGTRYRIENNGGSAHPLGFQNANSDYLLNQGGSGSLEGDSDINYVEDSQGITFTYTQTLADAVATYRCTIHASMEGTVQTGS